MQQKHGFHNILGCQGRERQEKLSQKGCADLKSKATEKLQAFTSKWTMFAFISWKSSFVLGKPLALRAVQIILKTKIFRIILLRFRFFYFHHLTKCVPELGILVFKLKNALISWVVHPADVRAQVVHATPQGRRLGDQWHPGLCELSTHIL